MRPGEDPIERLDEALKKLRVAYEKYFAGVERLEPSKERDEIKQALKRLMTASNNHNTARRFRLQTLQASLVTHEQHWDRITRQIEEGTYRRDLLRLQRRQAEAAREPSRPELEPSAPPALEAAAQSAAASAGAEPPAARPPQAAAGQPTGHSESIRRLYDAFMRARAQTGESKPISIEILAATVKKQIALVRDRHKCSRVEFTVTIKDGRAVLRAIPK